MDPTLRGVITEALGADLPMHSMQGRDGMQLWVGMWGTWWVNGDNPAAKIVLATVRATGGARLVSPQPLRTLPWVVLQLQVVEEGQPIWDTVVAILHDAFQLPDPRSDRRCPGRVAYDPVQEVHALRRVADPQRLASFKIVRVDRDAELRRPNAGARATYGDDGPRPVNTLQRERIPYHVFQGREGDLQPQAVQVFVERCLPRQMLLGQKLHAETGMVKESNLLAAVSEWHTWIVLLPAPPAAAAAATNA